MPDEIVKLVESYTGKPVPISYITINAGLDAEFRRFRQIISDEVKRKLEGDVRRLAVQGLLLGNERTTYEQTIFAISAEIDELVARSRNSYFRLKLDGIYQEVAFKDSMREIGELIQAIQLGDIPEDFYLRMERQLALLGNKNVYRGEPWERM